MPRSAGRTGNVTEKGNQSSLRVRNTDRVLSTLRGSGSFSRIDIAERTGLDKKTVTNIVNGLLEKGTVRVSSKQTDGLGRPKEILEINGDYTLCAGIDLGGTHLSGVIVNYAGNIITSYDLEVNGDMLPDTLVKLCGHLMETLLKKAGIGINSLSGIGVSFPGFVSSSSTHNVTSENLPQWQNIPIQSILETEYGVPVRVDDCSRLMALAEMWFGKGRGTDNFVVADLGLGIGCGIVIDRAVFRGSNGKSGEIGHTVVDVNGPKCTCGSHGCIESFAAGWALSKQAHEIKRKNPSSVLHETNGDSSVGINVRDVVVAANIGDKNCISLLKKSGEYIGLGLSNVISLFNPEKLIIGGRLIKDNEIMLESIIETIKVRCMKQILDDVEIVVSDLGISASAWGAGIACIAN